MDIPILTFCDSGGKVEPGETSLQAAKRELEVCSPSHHLPSKREENVTQKEEAGIQAPLEYAGTLLFLSEGADSAFHIDIYRAEEYTGLVTELVPVPLMNPVTQNTLL